MSSISVIRILQTFVPGDETYRNTSRYTSTANLRSIFQCLSKQICFIVPTYLMIIVLVTTFNALGIVYGPPIMLRNRETVWTIGQMELVV